MIATTLIPIRRNDGSPVGQPELNEIVQGLWKRFGGCTIEGVVTGHWVDPRDGTHYQDESLKVWIACDRSRIGELRATVQDIGRRLGQISMYLALSSDKVEYVDCTD